MFIDKMVACFGRGNLLLTVIHTNTVWTIKCKRQASKTKIHMKVSMRNKDHTKNLHPVLYYLTMIKILKLTTGEEVIADVDKGNSGWDLKNPVRLMISEQGVGMMPFAPFVKSDTVCISDRHIIYLGDADDEVRNAYNAKFGSGLVVASSDLKIVR